MKVTVVGKERMSGKSKKSGKDFDATKVYVTHKKSGVDGLMVDSIWLDVDDVTPTDIIVGKVYDVDRDSRGFVIGFTLA